MLVSPFRERGGGAENRRGVDERGRKRRRERRDEKERKEG